MDLKRLEYFCSVAARGSISKAAKELHISQPPLSARIRELEEELGVKLIHRCRNVWQLTPEGEEFYEKAQFVLSYVKGMAEETRKNSSKIAGMVRIGVCQPCLPYLEPLLPQLIRDCPELRYRIWIMDNQSLERHLQERHFDFILAQLPVRHHNYEIRMLATDPYYAVYGEAIAPPASDRAGVEELEGLPLILTRRRDGGGGYDLIMRAFQQSRKKLNILLDSQDTHLLGSLLRNGAPAVGILPFRIIVQEGLTALPRRPVDIPGVGLTPILVWLKSAYLPNHARYILECIRASSPSLTV